MAASTLIKNLIENRWKMADKETKKSFWEKTISNLSQNQLIELVAFSLKCFDIKIVENKLIDIAQAIKEEKDFLLSSPIIDIELTINREVVSNILECAYISEYRIDSVIMLPPEMRQKKIQDIADSIGVEPGLIGKVDTQWRKYQE